MKYHHLVLFCCALVAILCTRGALAEGKVSISTSHHVDPGTVHFMVTKSIDLKCNSTESGDFTWERAGKPVTEIQELKGRVVVSGANNNTLTLSKLKDSDAANYTCVIGSEGAKYTATVALAVSPSSKCGVRVGKNTNVVEGEKLTLKCEVRCDLSITWWYRNETDDDANFTLITGAEPRRTLLTYYDEERKVNVTNGELRIEEAEMSDRGEYMCQGDAEDGQKYTVISIVRVKDKYAALWPFLGICAEVFVLCAIIFIYEKKRNKTELEESDTDQSPDQKNTPDHGKESNLRHRQ